MSGSWAPWSRGVGRSRECPRHGTSIRPCQKCIDDVLREYAETLDCKAEDCVTKAKKQPEHIHAGWMMETEDSDSALMATRTRLVVLMREAQWVLDDHAHRLPEERVTAEECINLADGLAGLVTFLRDYAATLAGIKTNRRLYITGLEQQSPRKGHLPASELALRARHPSSQGVSRGNDNTRVDR